MIMKTAIFSQDIPVYDVSILAYSKITYSGTKIWTWHDSEEHSMQLMYPPPPPPLHEITPAIRFHTQNHGTYSKPYNYVCHLFHKNDFETVKEQFSWFFFFEHLEAFIITQRWWAGAQSVDSGTLCCLHKMLSQWHPYSHTLFSWK